MNLLCHSDPFEVDGNTPEEIKEIHCKQCGYNVMPEHHVLRTKELLKQVVSWEEKTLYRDAFKKLDFSKLPKNMDVQTAELFSRRIFDERLSDNISYYLRHPDEIPKDDVENKSNINFFITDDEINEIIKKALKEYDGGDAK